jgi:hypothetical protein
MTPLSICARSDLKSLRDLTLEHMHLLQNVYSKGVEVGGIHLHVSNTFRALPK